MTLIVFALLIGLIPAIFWLWFWLKEDRSNPEPKWLIIRVFALGGLMIIPAFLLQKEMHPGVNIELAENLVWLIVIWSVIEEVLKFLAAYFGGLRSRHFDEPIDAMIYLITAALGFVAIENTLYALGALQSDGITSLSFVLMGNLRFIGATVVHVVASALVGGMIGLAFYGSTWKKLIYIVVGLGGATALHSFFNYTIIKGVESDLFKIFLLFWFLALMIILFFEKIKQNIIQFKIDKQ